MDTNIVSASNDVRAKIHFLIGLTKFMTERVTYLDIKNHLKNALIEADDLGLKAMIAHNLAVINYCEI